MATVNLLAEKIKSLIAQKGDLAVSDFINLALFDENYGYYKTKNPIGKNSDFITAPEISQIFGELIAAYFVQIAATKKAKIAFVEMGAGQGTLFFDIITTIKKLAAKNIVEAADFIDRATFNIIETNPVLREIQQKKLAQFSIIWHENFADFLTAKKPESEIFFLSNELFDCFAIDQFVKTDIGWCARKITLKDNLLQFVTDKFDPVINNFVEKEIGYTTSQQAPFGAVFEYSKSGRDFAYDLSLAIEKAGGIAINIDYGYVKNDFANSLQAVKNHQKCDVLENVGECDITSLVDFSSLQKIAQDCGLKTSLITQREFLLALGIEERRKALIKDGLPRLPLANDAGDKKCATSRVIASEARQSTKKLEPSTSSNTEENINLAVERLIGLDQMGELFKFLITWK